MTRYDLHTHTIHSDGTLTPGELVSLARDRGVDVLAITDHDTVDALPAARKAAAQAGVRLVNGVEISAAWNKLPVHIVGLDIDPASPPLLTGLAENIELRNSRASAMFRILEARGIDLREAVREQAGPAAPTRTHFARAMVAAGLVPDMKRAFRRYLGKGRPVCVSTEWPSIEKPVSWIRQAGGRAVLAHPLAYGLTWTRMRGLLDEFASSGGDAIEVVTPRTEARQAKVLASLARDAGLSGSAGSDFHSPDQPWAMVGSCRAEMPLELPAIWNNWT